MVTADLLMDEIILTAGVKKIAGRDFLPAIRTKWMNINAMSDTNGNTDYLLSFTK
jgi:hypothetical protein